MGGNNKGFLLRFFYPFSYHHWERGSAHDWGGGGSSGTPRYKVTPLQVTVISSQL